MKNTSSGRFLLFHKRLTDEEIEKFLHDLIQRLYPNDTFKGSQGFFWEYTIHRQEGVNKTLIKLENDSIYLYRRTLPELSGVSIQLRQTKPSAFWTAEERAEDEAKKKRVREYSKAITIRAIQHLTLYKAAVQNSWNCKPGDFILAFVNKRMRKAFVWRGTCWTKCTLPCKANLSICSPLEFTIATGTTFAKTVEEGFGLEIEGREARGDAS